MTVNQTRTGGEQIKRFYVPFSREELERIDDFGFSARIRERSSVIRELVQIGLEAHSQKSVEEA